MREFFSIQIWLEVSWLFVFNLFRKHSFVPFVQVRLKKSLNVKVQFINL